MTLQHFAKGSIKSIKFDLSSRQPYPEHGNPPVVVKNGKLIMIIYHSLLNHDIILIDGLCSFRYFCKIV